MQYAYAVLWFLVGLILIFSLSKENKIFYFAGGFFLLLGGWWLADALLPDVNLFDGGWGIGMRAVCGAALVIFCVCFFLERRRTIQGEGAQSKEDKTDKK